MKQKGKKIQIESQLILKKKQSEKLVREENQSLQKIVEIFMRS